MAGKKEKQELHAPLRENDRKEDVKKDRKRSPLEGKRGKRTG